MANLYGVSNAPGLPFVVSNLGSVINCPANIGTVFYTSPPFVAPSQGYFYVIAWMDLVITNGAVVNTGMSFAYAIGGGSAVVSGSLGAYALTASANNYASFTILTAPAQVPWTGLGSTVALSISPAGQAISLQPLCNIVLGLFRAPDQ